MTSSFVQRIAGTNYFPMPSAVSYRTSWKSHVANSESPSRAFRITQVSLTYSKPATDIKLLQL